MTSNNALPIHQNPNNFLSPRSINAFKAINVDQPFFICSSEKRKMTTPTGVTIINEYNRQKNLLELEESVEQANIEESFHA